MKTFVVGVYDTVDGKHKLYVKEVSDYRESIFEAVVEHSESDVHVIEFMDELRKRDLTTEEIIGEISDMDWSITVPLQIG